MGRLPRSSIVSLMSLLSLRAGGFWLVHCLVLPWGLFYFFFLVARMSVPFKPPLGPIPEMVFSSPQSQHRVFVVPYPFDPAGLLDLAFPGLGTLA